MFEMARAVWMPRGAWTRGAAIVLVGAVLAFASASVTPERAEAQVSNIESLPKGTIGLGLIGVELGLIIPAAAGAQDWWPYLVFPVIGGAAGAVGGYFLDVETANQPEVGVSIFAVGVALLIPAIIGTLALTAYSPPDDAVEADSDMGYTPPPADDRVDAVQEGGAGTGEGSADDAGDAGQQARVRGRVPHERVLQSALLGGPGLLRLHRGQLLLGVPVPTSVARFSAEELERLPVRQHGDVNIPLVSGAF